MSDWKAVWSWDYALKGLDQHSGVQVDEQEWFDGPLREAYARGDFPKERLSDMVRRILRAVYLVGADTWSGPQPQPDIQAHLASTRKVAERGIVLLKNEGVLPLKPDVKTIAVIGGHADKGMVSGGRGSSLTDPIGGFALDIPLGGHGIFAGLRRLTVTRPSPVSELQQLFPESGGCGGHSTACRRSRRHGDQDRVGKPRQRRLEPALGTGSSHRSCDRCEPEYGGGAANRQPSRHALARQGARDRRVVVFGQRRRQGNCRGAQRRGQSVRPPARDLLRWCAADPASGDARLWHPDQHADRDRLSRGCRGGISLARKDR